MKRNLWYKIGSLFLALLLTAACALPTAAAAKQAKPTPILIVSGFTEYLLYNTQTGENAFPHNQSAIVDTVKGVLPALLTLLGSGRNQSDYDAFCDAAIPVLNRLFEDIACNPDGSVKHPEVQLKYQYPEAVSHYGVETVAQKDAFDKDLLYGAVDAVGAENVYVYGLDWRLDPFTVADEIHEWITHIQSVHRCKKVSIAGISMGGVIVSAYLAKYGADALSNITMISSAFTGLSMIGALFTGGVEIDEQGLYRMLNQTIGTDTLSQLIGSTGLVKQIIALIDDLYAAERDRIFSECLIPAYGYNPGMWAFVPTEDLAAAKEFMFTRMPSSESEKAVLSAKIDAYAKAAAEVKDTLQAAKASGANVAIVSNYNYQMPPVSTASGQTGDQTIETVRTSGGATCAPQGKTLPESVGNGIYVSPDRMINAATCMLPEETWFIKNMKHVGFDNRQNQCAFYAWLMTADAPVTVRSDSRYPQFLLYNEASGVLSPLTLLRGDVNFDSRVDLLDARATLRFAQNRDSLSPLAAEAADMNADNRHTRADAQSIMQVYAGVETPAAVAFSAESLQAAVQQATQPQAQPDSPQSNALPEKIGALLEALGKTAKSITQSRTDAYSDASVHTDNELVSVPQS